MKSILLAVLFLFVPKLAISQIFENDKIIHLDSTFNETKNKNHPYFRITRDYKLKKESYVVNDYNLSGVLLMEGTSKNKEYLSKEGEFIYYYENKNKKAITNFVKNRPIGKEFRWYENGEKKQEGEYIVEEKKNESEYKVNQFWDINGVQKVTDGNGDYEEKDKDFLASGKVKNGFKDGVWEGSFNKSKYSYKEVYKEGKFISGVSTNTDGETYTYSELEIKPEHKNGIMDFYKFIAKNYKTPNIQGLKGKIYITFVVDKDGKIVEPKILRDLGYGTGQEAIRVITGYNGFIPGEQRGRKVRCTYSLPISIQSAY